MVTGPSTAMLSGSWRGIYHLTRPTDDWVGAREWLSDDCDGQMMLADMLSFHVLWHTLLPRKVAANSETGSGGSGGPPVRRFGGIRTPGVAHVHEARRLRGEASWDFPRWCVQTTRTSCGARRRSAIDGPSEGVFHGRAIGRALTGHQPQGGRGSGLLGPSGERITSPRPAHPPLPSTGGGEDAVPRLHEVGRGWG